MLSGRGALGPWAVVAAAPLLLIARSTWFVCDDAYIAGRYARRLAAGQGWSFNLADPPVEGFSDLLWVLLGALAEAAGLSAPTVWPWLSLAAGVATVVVVVGAASRRAGPGASLAAGAVLAAFPPFAVWSTSGLEAMVVALGVVGLLDALERGAPRAAVGWVVMTALLRAEGPLWALAVLVLGRRLPGATGAPWAAWGVVTAGVALWRAWVFGALAPHTAVVKVLPSVVGPARGLAWLLLAALVWMTPLLALLVGRLREDPRWPGLRPWCQAAGVVVGFGVLVGGDYLPFHRFLVPAWPLCVPALAVALDRLASPRWLPGATGALVLVGGLGLVDLHPAPREVLHALQRVVGTDEGGVYRSDAVALRRERSRSAGRVAWARALGDVLPPGTSIVSRGVGALGYFTELHVLDPYGLVTPDAASAAPTRAIAPGHDRRVQRGYFLDREPEVLFATALDGEDKGAVIEHLPRQWGLFEVLAPDEAVFVAELVAVPPSPEPRRPAHLLLIRPMPAGADPEALRVAFKDAVRAAGYRAPKLEPLDERRRAVALEKRRGGAHLQEVLWSSGRAREAGGQVRAAGEVGD